MKDYPELKIGSKGDYVKLLKAKLASRGFHPYSDDPNFYAATSGAVTHYQQTHVGRTGRFLVETEPKGVVTEEVWLALDGTTPQKLGIKSGNPGAPKKSILAAFIAQLKARRKDGVAETPRGSNWGGGVTVAIQDNKINFPIPWCAAEINYDLRSAGFKPPWGNCVRVCEIWNIAKRLGLTIKGPPAPGDLFVMLSKPLLKTGLAPDVNGHIGAVLSVEGADFITAEGNSDDRLRIGRRSISSVAGWIRLFEPIDIKQTQSIPVDAGGKSDR